MTDWPLYVGLAAGFNRFSYRTRFNFSGVDGTTDATFALQTLYLAPVLGLSWRKASGFTIGTEIGYQFPLLAGGSLDAQSSAGQSPEQVRSLAAAAEGPMDYYASLKKPSITLIRIGWLF